MKTLFFILFTLIIVSFIFADQSLTRGPEIGEIYFYGPVVNEDNNGLYHSTNFGETATCMDSTVIGSFNADLFPGVIYRERFGVLYFSEDYGQQGTWVQRPELVSEIFISSGVSEGKIYSSFHKHSEDYGLTFHDHFGQGFFGNINDLEIDNEEFVGYIVVNETSIPDSMWLLISYNDFDELEMQTTLNFAAPTVYLTRGTENGELYLYTYYWGIGDGRKLRYSNDYGITWELKNSFNCPNLPIKSIVGGRQTGELYMLVKYIQDMYYVKHTYIYHSLDYGETFTVYHNFAYGEDPAFAYFEAAPTEGPASLTVQFTDLSQSGGGNIVAWEWDFNNDGEIDSYEQHPEYTYQDTGYYSVSLQVLNFGSGGTEDFAFREDYIHVTEGNSSDDEIVNKKTINLVNYPNPFNPSTEIRFQISEISNVESPKIEIYNLKGQKVKTLPVILSRFEGSAVWYGDDQNGKPVSSGIYLFKLNTENSLVNKMILLR